MTDTKPARLALPTLRLDYTAGTFLNTLTGEQSESIDGVVLAYREDRVLWPTIGENYGLPLCVNGSEFGPCRCAFADWGKDGTPPDCAEELSFLLWQETQLVVLTARRSQIKPLVQYVEMQNLLREPLHAQRITVDMRPGDGGDLHRLRLRPQDFLDTADRDRLGRVAERVGQAFGGEDA